MRPEFRSSWFCVLRRTKESSLTSSTKTKSNKMQYKLVMEATVLSCYLFFCVWQTLPKYNKKIAIKVENKIINYFKNSKMRSYTKSSTRLFDFDKFSHDLYKIKNNTAFGQKNVQCLQKTWKRWLPEFSIKTKTRKTHLEWLMTEKLPIMLKYRGPALGTAAAPVARTIVSTPSTHVLCCLLYTSRCV